MNMTIPKLSQLLPLLALLHTPMPTKRRSNEPGRHHHQLRGVPVPTKTGPLDMLTSKRPVVILDVENLTASAHRLGREFDYCGLYRLLQAAGKQAEVHAVFSRTKDDTRWASYFAECNIQAHPRTVKQVTDRNGTRTTMNSYLSLAVMAGTLVNKRTREVIIGTGDGECAVEISEALKAHFSKMRIVTLGVPGSISSRIRADSEGYIDGNLIVGADCLINDSLPHF